MARRATKPINMSMKKPASMMMPRDDGVQDGRFYRKIGEEVGSETGPPEVAHP